MNLRFHTLRHTVLCGKNTRLTRMQPFWYTVLTCTHTQLHVHVHVSAATTTKSS